jgi:hypothetical protein
MPTLKKSTYAATVRKSAATQAKIRRKPIGIHNSPKSESMHYPESECVKKRCARSDVDPV